MEAFNALLDAVNTVLWHDAVLYTVLGVGVLFTVWSGFSQYRAVAAVDEAFEFGAAAISRNANLRPAFGHRRFDVPLLAGCRRPDQTVLTCAGRGSGSVHRAAFREKIRVAVSRYDSAIRSSPRQPARRARARAASSCIGSR